MDSQVYGENFAVYLITIAVVLSLLHAFRKQRLQNLPAGPWVHPVHGHSKQIMATGGLIYFFRQLQNRYGSVSSIFYFNKWTQACAFT